MKTDEIKKQLLDRFGFIDGGVDAENQLKIFSFMDWYETESAKERAKKYRQFKQVKGGDHKPRVKPTDKDIEKGFRLYTAGWDEETKSMSDWKDGAKWMRDKLIK